MTNMLFGDNQMESITIGDEVMFFCVEDDTSLWSVGDDDIDEENLSELALYNLK